MREIANCVIVGSNGNFGRIFAAKLADKGIRICGIDLEEQPGSLPRDAIFIADSILTMSRDETRRAIAGADCIIFCASEEIVLGALNGVFAIARPDALVIDILSVKSNIVQAVSRAPKTPGYLSIHPMFGPMVDFSGRPVALIPVKPNARSEAFVGILNAWNAQLVEVGAGEHDTITACIQILPHAALISFGMTLQASGVSMEKIWALGTPIQKLMLALLSRVSQTGHDTYWTIQSNNPHGPKVRESFADNLSKFVAGVDAGDAAAFASRLDAINDYFGKFGRAAIELSERAVLLTREPNT